MGSTIPIKVRGFRHLLELGERRVEARLHGSNGDFQDFRNLSILEIFVVGEDQGLTERVGEFCHAFSDPLFLLLALELSERARFIVDEEVNQTSRVGFRGGRTLIQTHRRVPAGFSQGVNRLMGRDRVKPRANGASILVKTAFQVNLEEGVLKHIFRQRRVTRVAGEVAIKFGLIAVNERVEILGAAFFSVAREEILVRNSVEFVSRSVDKGLSHIYAPPRRNVRGHAIIRRELQPPGCPRLPPPRERYI